MLYVVVYDLPATKAGNRRRRHLARFLDGHGNRCQYSVFEIRVQSQDELQHICKRVEALIEPGQDAVRIYPLRADAEQGVLIFGEGQVFRVPDAVFL